MTLSLTQCCQESTTAVHRHSPRLPTPEDTMCLSADRKVLSLTGCCQAARALSRYSTSPAEALSCSRACRALWSGSTDGWLLLLVLSEMLSAVGCVLGCWVGCCCCCCCTAVLACRSLRMID